MIVEAPPDFWVVTTSDIVEVETMLERINKPTRVPVRFGTASILIGRLTAAALVAIAASNTVV
jgi:hypothetical protein